MVGVLKRMRRLQELLDVRAGPGAAILAGDVKRIHLTFAKKMQDGHMGPRKFWHEYLPRLKYHNPAISMTVDRTEDNSGSAPLTILFTSSPVDTQAPGPTQSTSLDKAASDHQPFDRTHLIEMKHKHPSEILEELLAVTQAREVKPTQEERMAMEELVDQRRRSDHDREMQKQVLAKKRREKEILEQARRSVEMQTG